MKRIGFVKLILLSIAWVVFVGIESANSISQLNWDILYNETFARSFIEMGILPIFYLWSILISTKILFYAKA